MTLCSIILLYLGFYNSTDSDNYKMRTILAIVVISCVFIVASSQSDCLNRANDVNNCISRLSYGSRTNLEAYCNECGNSLIRYYRDCTSGAAVDAGIDAVKQGKFFCS